MAGISELYLGVRNCYRLNAGLRRLRLDESGGADFYAESRDRNFRATRDGSGCTNVQGGSGRMILWNPTKAEADNPPPEPAVRPGQYVSEREQERRDAEQHTREWREEWARREAAAEEARREREKYRSVLVPVPGEKRWIVERVKV